MKVFITGAAGFIGRALTVDLLAHGHTVVGLARSDASAKKLEQIGAQVIRGDLDDLDSLKRGASQCDATVHLAFHHDYQDFEKPLAMDRAAITAMGEALEGTGKGFVIASGTLTLPKNTGVVATEDTEAETSDDIFAQRAKSATLVREMSKSKGIRGIVIRLPPTVHGKGDQSIIPTIAQAMKAKGKVVMLGEGENKWSAVHLDDAVSLFRLAVERGAAGAVYHAVGEEGVRMCDILGVAAKKMGLPVEKVDFQALAEAAGQLGPLVAIDNQVSSEKTQRELGWTVKGPGLVADLEANYF